MGTIAVTPTKTIAVKRSSFLITIPLPLSAWSIRNALRIDHALNGSGIVMRKLLRFTAIVLVGVTAMVPIGVVYQTVSTARDRRIYPPPGHLFDVGGYRLHLYCMGAGSPTVVLLGASFDTVSDWNWVQPKVARVTRV